MIKHNVGLVNTNITVGQGMFPSNVVTAEEILDRISKYFLVSKPKKEEKGKYNTHKTVKPLAVCEYIIRLCTFSKDAIVLDPFVGSGTTAVAAKKLGRKYIGIDSNKECVNIALRRLKEVSSPKESVEQNNKEKQD